MSVTDKLASSFGRRDEVPNQELAKQIVATNDKKAIKELVEHLKNKDIQSDCIKVLYEAGAQKPELISDYAVVFTDLLENKNNRLVWGAMTAIDAITLREPETVYSVLGKLVTIAAKGTVITRDRFVSILTKLASVKQYADDAFVLLLEQIQSCPPNQLPMYAENAVPVVTDKNKARFIKILTTRLADIEQDAKRKRIEKVIRKVA